MTIRIILVVAVLGCMAPCAAFAIDACAADTDGDGYIYVEIEPADEGYLNHSRTWEICLAPGGRILALLGQVCVNPCGGGCPGTSYTHELYEGDSLIVQDSLLIRHHSVNGGDFTLFGRMVCDCDCGYQRFIHSIFLDCCGLTGTESLSWSELKSLFR